MLNRIIAASLLLIPGIHTQLIAQQMPSPSEEHQVVMKDVGEWTVKGRMLMPDGFQEFEGKEKVTPIGQFWTVSHFSADIFGGLKGSSTMGFDPSSKQFVGTWVDSFQPAATQMKGKYDEATKTMTYETIGVGMDGKPMPGKIIVQYKDDNSRTFTMMHPDPTGESDQLVKTMEMTYTRKNDKKDAE